MERKILNCKANPDHFVHQHSNREAVTFWAGCGAIRREVFHKVGGYDQDRYETASIEDIELGYRSKRMGYRVLSMI